VTVSTQCRPVNKQTVQRPLRDHGLSCRRPFREPILTPDIRRRRFQWAQQRLRWT
ncbi:hypothetical protein CAPTEDRAFT_105843, partial [Capitella teleta]